MDTQDKRQSLSKKLNEFTGHLTPGQMTKIDPNEIRHYFNVYLGRDPYQGESGTVNEYKVYQNHPDNSALIKDLKVLKSRHDSELKQAQTVQPGTPGQGQGGPIDNFASVLAAGASSVGGKISSLLGSLGTTQPTSHPTSSPANQNQHISTGTRTGYRTDRNNNPTAMTTDVAMNAGLKPGIDFVTGDPFQGGDGRVYHTARLLGDAVQTTIKAIDNAGFYTQSGKQRWTYTNKIPGTQAWKNLSMAQKAAIVKQMYHFEGGSGKLTGMGGPRDLGNVTTNFGEQTKDTNFHRGIDIANANGTPIPKLMPTGGTVTHVGPNGDYGNQVTVKNNNGTTETYSHLRRSTVQPGQKIGPQQQIGEMGDTGNSWSASGGDPSHLHYEVIDAYNHLVNPTNFIGV